MRSFRCPFMSHVRYRPFAKLETLWLQRTALDVPSIASTVSLRPPRSQSQKDAATRCVLPSTKFRSMVNTLEYQQPATRLNEPSGYCRARAFELGSTQTQ